MEFLYTPKHSDWLNMAEVEIGIRSGLFLNCRFASRPSSEWPNILIRHELVAAMQRRHSRAVRACMVLREP